MTVFDVTLCVNTYRSPEVCTASIPLMWLVDTCSSHPYKWWAHWYLDQQKTLKNGEESVAWFRFQVSALDEPRRVKKSAAKCNVSALSFRRASLIRYRQAFPFLAIHGDTIELHFQIFPLWSAFHLRFRSMLDSRPLPFCAQELWDRISVVDWRKRINKKRTF